MITKLKLKGLTKIIVFVFNWLNWEISFEEKSFAFIKKKNLNTSLSCNVYNMYEYYLITCNIILMVFI
jgi:hypothetical protein